MNESNRFEISNRLFYILIVLLAGLVLFWTFRMYEIYKTSTGNYPREITVEGKGKAYIVPDVAQITLGVHTEGAASDATVQANTEKINKVMEAIKSFGIDQKDIKTVGYYLNPKYEWTEKTGSTQNGFTLDQSIEIKMKDFAKVGDLIAATTKAGANTIGGVQFVVDDEDSAKGEAREEAIAKAKAKAEEIADSTGLKLGRVINFYEYADSGYYPYAMKSDVGMGGAIPESMPAPSIEPGQQEVNLTVSLTFRLN